MNNLRLKIDNSLVYNDLLYLTILDCKYYLKKLDGIDDFIIKDLSFSLDDLRGILSLRLKHILEADNEILRGILIYLDYKLKKESFYYYKMSFKYIIDIINMYLDNRINKDLTIKNN